VPGTPHRPLRGSSNARGPRHSRHGGCPRPCPCRLVGSGHGVQAVAGVVHSWRHPVRGGVRRSLVRTPRLVRHLAAEATPLRRLP
jgi:hypothetical protein